MIDPDRLYIVNEVDRPDQRHVAYLVNGKLSYLEIEWYPMALTERATPLADFGFSFEQVGHGVLCTIVRDSTATYPDGTRRQWQGAFGFVLLNRHAEAIK